MSAPAGSLRGCKPLLLLLPVVLQQCIMHMLSRRERVILAHTCRDWLRAARDPFAWKFADPRAVCRIQSDVGALKKNGSPWQLITFIPIHLDLLDFALYEIHIARWCLNQTRSRMVKCSIRDVFAVDMGLDWSTAFHPCLTSLHLELRHEGGKTLTSTVDVAQNIVRAYPQLESVSLDVRTFDALDIDRFMEHIVALPRLTSLSVDWWFRNGGLTLWPCPTLRFLSLRALCHNEFRLRQGSSFPSFPNLETLTLRGFRWTDTEERLQDAFRSLVSLHTLSLDATSQFNAFMRSTAFLPSLIQLNVCDTSTNFVESANLTRIVKMTERAAERAERAERAAALSNSPADKTSLRRTLPLTITVTREE